MSVLARLSPDAPPLIALAPMEGVVDWVVRDLLTALGGIDLCVTEFIRVTDQSLPDLAYFKACPELKTAGHTGAGVPVLVQLLGGQPGPMAVNAARAIALGAVGIDLNFGCPAKTVNRHDGGAALLKDPHRVYDVTHAVRAAVPMSHPVSAKVRLGFSDKTRFLEIAQAAQEAGASWLTIHARTRDEGYRPPAHWEYIARIREKLSIPVIANGEIWSLEDYEQCRTVSGCRHTMIGRGLMARPDLAREILMGSGRFSWHESLDFLRAFATRSETYRNASYAVCRLKQMLKSFARENPSAQRLFEDIKRLERLEEIQSRLTQAYTDH